MTDPAQARASALKGVGPQLEAKLEALGICSVADLLFHLPLRYQDRTQLKAIGELQPGGEALVHGRIEASGVRFGRRRSLITVLSDDTARLTMRQFYFNASQQRALKRGAYLQCYGEVRSGPAGLEMVHPEYRVVDSPDAVTVEASLTPVYPTTEGIGQSRWRDLTGQALDRCADAIPELLGDWAGFEFSDLSLAEALRLLHRPPAGVDLDALKSGTHPAQQRLAFEELLANHLALRRRRERRDALSARAILPSTELWPRLRESLGFSLTEAQTRSIEELMQDLAKAQPALRLVQGDVGCGKTIVAAAAVLAAIEAGEQAVVMAPTELLAEQHLRTFSQWFEPLGIRPVWLSGRIGTAERRQACEQLASGSARIAIGTHALFQDEVAYHRLGLVVVDEQHRFGVAQRLALRDKGHSEDGAAHQIIMSATPIPRSLTMVMYADMDISVIDEMPPGRQPVETVVLPNTRREDVQARIREACARGRRAYWVCPLIEDSDALAVQAATSRAEALTAELPELRIALLHGKIAPAEKDAIMEDFRQGRLDVLVATTVIEVGVDVPEASLMIIENAERLGLSQLHQLRGRVGRGDRKSVCVLMYQAPLGNTAKERLATLRQSTDGFVIAQKDLELRGPGELLGTRQSGAPQFRIADLARDRALLPAVQHGAQQLLRDHPEKAAPLMARWVREGLAFSHA